MRHLFFDLDHTLWDFEKNSQTALSILYEDLKLSNHLRSFQSFHTAYKKINAALWFEYGKGNITKEELRIKRFSRTLSHFDVRNKPLAEELAVGYMNISPYQTHVFPNAHKTLGQLKNEGYELHIITNGFREVQFIKLKKSNLLDYFDIVLCSEEVGKNKPHRLVFDRAVEMAGTHLETSVMIGDNYHADIIGAENAGMKAILFDPKKSHKQGTHRWHVHELSDIPSLLPFMF